MKVLSDFIDNFFKFVASLFNHSAQDTPVVQFAAMEESARGARHEEKPTSYQTSQPMRKLGVALVGLGQYSMDQLAPALLETELCYLAGLVTGSPEKADELQRKYSIPQKNIYNYENFDSIAGNDDIDIVYVVLPNAMHAEFTIRAAQAGKHVICEKPMAVSVEECERMIEACREANRLLAIGYRLHFEPHNQAIMEFGHEERFGPIKTIIAKDEIKIEPNVWRLKKNLAGGGPVMDVGIYCVQGALYTIGEQPIAVTAVEGRKTDKEKFSEVEESMAWEMEFPSGAHAFCVASYTNHNSLLRAEAEKGFFELEPAYDYAGIKGKTSEGSIARKRVNQQALQMDDFACSVLSNTRSKVCGEMGLRDVRILMAIYESARKGERIKL